MLKGNKGLTRDRGSLPCLFPCLEQGCKPAEVQGTMLPDDSDKSPWTLPYQHTSGWSPTTCMASSHTTLILLDDEVLAGCEDVIAVLMGRELEKKNWVCSKGEGIDSKAGTEGPAIHSAQEELAARGIAPRGDAARVRILDTSVPISEALLVAAR